jgi:hypothetical protein
VVLVFEGAGSGSARCLPLDPVCVVRSLRCDSGVVTGWEDVGGETVGGEIEGGGIVRGREAATGAGTGAGVGTEAGCAIGVVGIIFEGGAGCESA